MKFKYHHLLTPAIYLLISYLCLTSIPIPSSFHFTLFGIPNADKWVHGILYFTLTSATMFELFKMNKFTQGRLSLVWAIILPILFGGAMELAQLYWIVGRSAEWSDFAANSAGVICGYFASRGLLNRLSSK